MAAVCSSALSLGSSVLSMLIQLFPVCCLILLSQEPVSSLRRKQESVLAVQLCAQNSESGDRDEEDDIMRNEQETKGCKVCLGLALSYSLWCI